MRNPRLFLTASLITIPIVLMALGSATFGQTANTSVNSGERRYGEAQERRASPGAAQRRTSQGALERRTTGRAEERRASRGADARRHGEATRRQSSRQ